jgi:hypothetical protein
MPYPTNPAFAMNTAAGGSAIVAIITRRPGPSGVFLRDFHVKKPRAMEAQMATTTHGINQK